MVIEKDVLDRVRFLCTFYFNKFKVKDYLDDIYQDVILKLIKSDYLSRYDSSRPIHNFLSGFVYNYFCKIYKVGNYKVNSATSIYKEIDKDIFLIDSLSSKSFSVDFSIFMEQAKKVLDKEYQFSSFVAYLKDFSFVGSFTKDYYPIFNSLDHIIIFKRTPGQVFKFLSFGYNQNDIKELLFVSKSWVSKAVNKISDCKVLIEFAKTEGF